MSQISLKSISGITSITTPAGVDNRFSLYNFDSTERLVLDHSGNLNISGVSQLPTGFNNVHSVGFDVVSSTGAGCTIRESGNAVFSGMVTATQLRVMVHNYLGWQVVSFNLVGEVFTINHNK